MKKIFFILMMFFIDNSVKASNNSVSSNEPAVPSFFSEEGIKETFVFLTLSTVVSKITLETENFIFKKLDIANDNPDPIDNFLCKAITTTAVKGLISGSKNRKRDAQMNYICAGGLAVAHLLYRYIDSNHK